MRTLNRSSVLNCRFLRVRNCSIPYLLLLLLRLPLPGEPRQSSAKPASRQNSKITRLCVPSLRQRTRPPLRRRRSRKMLKAIVPSNRSRSRSRYRAECPRPDLRASASPPTRMKALTSTALSRSQRPRNLKWKMRRRCHPLHWQMGPNSARRLSHRPTKRQIRIQRLLQRPRVGGAGVGVVEVAVGIVVEVGGVDVDAVAAAAQ